MRPMGLGVTARAITIKTYTFVVSSYNPVQKIKASARPPSVKNERIKHNTNSEDISFTTLLSRFFQFNFLLFLFPATLQWGVLRVPFLKVLPGQESAFSLR
jgi:hypothetical protein